MNQEIRNIHGGSHEVQVMKMSKQRLRKAEKNGDAVVTTWEKWNEFISEYSIK